MNLHDIFSALCRPALAMAACSVLAGCGGFVLPTAQSGLKNSIGMEFALIPSGSFVMGCRKGDDACEPDEKPLHEVSISKPFYLGKYVVTQEEWVRVMGDNPSTHAGFPRRPVDSVSWVDAKEFIRRLNRLEDTDKYSLPTEAQWEYAARAGTTTKYSDKKAGWLAWHAEGGMVTATRNVGEGTPNPWGLYDMHTNVYEWVQDWYDKAYYRGSPAVDPGGPSSGDERVLRLGRSASRYSLRPDSDYKNSGFRVALALGHRPSPLETVPAQSGKEPDPPPEVIANTIGIELIRIPNGTFMMGCAEQDPDCHGNPKRKVTLAQPFYLGKYEITLGQWKAVMGQPVETINGLEMYLGRLRSKNDKMPVVGPTWHQAREFVVRLNRMEGTDKYRLPTEAEWEYAARAGTITPYWFGSDAARFGSFEQPANGAQLHPAGGKQPNPFGLYDMLGNALEWVQGLGDEIPKDDAIDPQGSEQEASAVARGGMSYDRRVASWTTAGNERTGFRIALSPGHYPKSGAVPGKAVASAANVVEDATFGMKFVCTAPGAFVMGCVKTEQACSAHEQGQRRVSFEKPFCIGKYEVTQDVWDMVMKGRYDGGDSTPVWDISWKDAKAFAERLTRINSRGDVFRLPTEAEWEYAARAGTATAFSFGDDASLLADYAWQGEDAVSRRRVGTKLPNPWGMFDVHGNVAEWTQENVLRGGAWDDEIGNLRSAARIVPGSEERGGGLRLVVEPGTAPLRRAAKKDANSIGMEFALVPAGSFVMRRGGVECDGDGDSKESKKVRKWRVNFTKPLYVSKFEVTQDEWNALMDFNPSVVLGGRLPVDNVLWRDAQEFVRRLNAKEGTDKYRLPTEAEWEYAARAGAEASHAADGKLPGNHGVFNDTGPEPVGSLQANRWGLYDMQGNVAEWVQDWWEKDGIGYTGVVTNPRGPREGSYRVIRGGSWESSASSRWLTCRRAEQNAGRDGAGVRIVFTP
jgi:formylglycine-generating enzyme required for sulfatase activity